ncbi:MULTISPECIES: hypothetical protein [Paracoccus]|uniref:Uncharacterized protein n=1 Tax=Paracoccus versutus TaxID=34007 RepID=A0A3D9XTT8_PARVE|nr:MULTISPECIES: hypothetical protein [Paracoccus]REF73121.1 hypothetical protein BDD41_1643 [Paracoccus versutus]WGR54976.1 hypothetical protein E3U25_02655 [Paracoccus versutus]
MTTPRAKPDPARWLALAAAPCFAVMAWITAASPALCLSGPGPLPLYGMTMMYLLMALFHLPPWLRLMAGQDQTRKGD